MTTTVENQNLEPQNEAVDYRKQLPDLIDQATAMSDPVDRKDLMRDLVDSFIKDATEGKIVGSHGVYSADMMRHALDGVWDVYNKPDQILAPELKQLRDTGRADRAMTSAAGLRTVINELISREETSSPFFEAILEEQRDHDAEIRKVGSGAAEVAGVRPAVIPKLTEIMSGDQKPELITGIPESIRNNSKPVEDAPADPEKPRSVADRLKDLTASLPIEERLLLRYYADALEDKAIAQKAGDGEASIQAGQRAGQYYRQLAPASQMISDQFVSLYRRS